MKCLQLGSVQSLSHVWLFATPWNAVLQASLSSTNSWSLLKIMSIESVMPSSHLILCHALLLPSVFPSITVFSLDLFIFARVFKHFYWSIFALQCCFIFCCKARWISYTYTHSVLDLLLASLRHWRRSHVNKKCVQSPAFLVWNTFPPLSCYIWSILLHLR